MYLNEIRESPFTKSRESSECYVLYCTQAHVIDDVTQAVQPNLTIATNVFVTASHTHQQKHKNREETAKPQIVEPSLAKARRQLAERLRTIQEDIRAEMYDTFICIANRLPQPRSEPTRASLHNTTQNNNDDD